MDRTVKTKTVRSLNKGERAVLLPGQNTAEPWEVWLLGAGVEPRCVQVCPSPLDNRLIKSTTLALPVAQVFSLPLWLNETNPKQLAEMIPLQLELRGLQPRGSHAVFDWTVVKTEGSRTLVTVGVLPSTLTDEIKFEAYETFELSARYMTFPENSVILWKEHDVLVVAVTREAHLVYWQALAEGKVTPRIIQDLNCMKATLTMQEILLPLRQVVLWTEASLSELTLLKAAFQLPIQQEEEPLPKAPASSWKLTPATFNEAKRSREARRWWKRGVLCAVMIYLLIVATLALRLGMTSRKVEEVRQWQTAHSQEIALVRDTRAAWKSLRPALDQDQYPLELLLHVSEAIPTDQLHMTLFEDNDGHLLIKGEAKNAAIAFQFLDKLKSDPRLAGYTWDMGQPHLLPNDLAQLQIEGTYASTN